MIVDALDLEDGVTLSFDVCIVGSGPAGMTAALALSGSGLSVGVLESGGFTQEPSTQALYDGTMSGINTWRLDNKRFRLFGGSSSRWAGWCRPLGPDDFPQRDYISSTGWPLSFADLEPFYRLAQVRLQLGDLLYDAAAIAQAEGLPLLVPDSDRVTTSIYQFSPPTRFGDVYRADLQSDEDVEVYLHANVVEIVLNDPLGSVDRLSCQTLDGNTFDVTANHYVLATGGLEVVRLLLASNAQIDEGVANSSDAVGRYFMEHPHYYSSAAWVSYEAPDLAFYRRHVSSVSVGDDALDEIDILGTIGLSEAIRASEGLPRASFQIAGANPDNASTGMLSPAAIEAMVCAREEGCGFHLLTGRVEQTPDPDSRVTLTEAVDALGVPRLDLNWQVADADNVTMRRTLEILGAELAAEGLGRIWTPTEDGVFSFNVQPGGHHLGTTRMSTDPADGVVDVNCRCHDVDNLFVLSSAVFPTGGDSNPTLTIVALAERLAAHLIEVTSS